MTPADQLTWYRQDRYYMQSGCGRYNVSRGLSRGVPRYSAWRNGQPMAELIDCFDSAQEAKDACQADADAQAEKALA